MARSNFKPDINKQRNAIGMYALDYDELELGDIILIKSESEISRLVRRLTNSQYSHAILYVGSSSCIDSDGYGVQANNLQRIVFENVDDAIVLRINDNHLKPKLKQVEMFARQKIGTEYSTSEAKLAMLKKELVAQQPNRQFCTRFITQSYNSVGIKLTENIDYCLPEDLIESSILTKIENIVRKASEKQIEFAKSENPLSRQAEIHNLILRKSREISGQDIQTFEQLSDLIIAHQEYDEEITKIISESGYLTMMEADKEKNPWHYDAQLMIEHYKIPEAIVNTALFFAETENSTRERLVMTISTLRAANRQFPRKYFEMEIQLYEKLIDFSQERESAALQVLKHY